MEKSLKDIEYEELSEWLQSYLDKGETKCAIEMCERVARAGNRLGYLFMAFIYEEGHGEVSVDYEKAMQCYKQAEKRKGNEKEKK